MADLEVHGDPAIPAANNLGTF